MSRSIENRLAWLAGIVDGEGCISLRLEPRARLRKDGRGSFVLRCEVTIVNTCDALISEVRAVAAELGVVCYLQLVPPPKKALVRQNKLVWRVVFNSMKQVVPLLTALVPFLIGKRLRAETVLSLIEERKASRRGFSTSITAKDEAWLKAQLDGLRIVRR